MKSDAYPCRNSAHYHENFAFVVVKWRGDLGNWIQSPSQKHQPINDLRAKEQRRRLSYRVRSKGMCNVLSYFATDVQPMDPA